MMQKLAEQIDAINALVEEGNYADALTIVTSLLEQHPHDAEIWSEKAKLHSLSNQVAEAIACYNQALRLKPDDIDACINLAMILESSGQTDLAIKIFEYWIKLRQQQACDLPPNITISHEAFLLAKAAFEEGDKHFAHRQLHAAEAAYRRALQFTPNMPELMHNIAMTLHYQNRNQEAVDLLFECLRIRPQFDDALNTLGCIYRANNQYAIAIAAFRQTLAINPNYIEAASNLAKLYLENAKIIEAIEANLNVLRIDPQFPDAICDLTYLYRITNWEQSDVMQSRMKQLLSESKRPLEPFIVTTMIDDAQLQKKNAVLKSSVMFPSPGAYNTNTPLPYLNRPEKRIRIGYLSSDFNRHATARLMSELLELHDRSLFEIYAYSYGKNDKSDLRQRIQAAVDHFVDVRALGDHAIADMIHADGIDIAIDLKGYTQGERLGILRTRPAPIQMHYLGYPGTLGTEFIDYFISDNAASPKGSDEYFTEKLIRLLYSYQINDRKRPLPDSTKTRSDYGLPEDGFVFCAFNNTYKITPDIFAVWMRLLKKVEKSVLWMYALQSESMANITSHAIEHGIDPNRIIFARNVSFIDHISRYQHADLFLDTSPVCGHTTTSDALWCGLPVVTLAGTSFVSRVAVSLLNAVHLPELVTSSLQEYEEIAFTLSQDRKRLQALKQHLHDGRFQFPLFDCVQTTRALETAYLKAIKKHEQGLIPEAFLVDESTL